MNKTAVFRVRWLLSASLLLWIGVADAESCKPVAGLAPLLAEESVILVGELHGTNQFPSFVGSLVCAALKNGLPVTLALEIPRDETGRLTRFLASDGGRESQAALYADSPFWRGDVQDGRRSIAMYELIEQVRGLRKAGQPVTLIAIDRASDDTAGQRDEVMALNLREAVKKNKPSVTIVLTGNLHNRLVDHPQFGKPMGAYLDDLKPSSLEPSYDAGSAWVCIPECGDHSMKGTPGSVEPSTITAQADSRRYTFGVGPLTVSKPAHVAFDAAANVTQNVQAPATL